MLLCCLLPSQEMSGQPCEALSTRSLLPCLCSGGDPGERAHSSGVLRRGYTPGDTRGTSLVNTGLFYVPSGAGCARGCANTAREIPPGCSGPRLHISPWFTRGGTGRETVPWFAGCDLSHLSMILSSGTGVLSHALAVLEARVPSARQCGWWG